MNLNEKYDPFGLNDAEQKVKHASSDISMQQKKEQIKVTMPLWAIVVCAIIIVTILAATIKSVSCVKDAERRIAQTNTTPVPAAQTTAPSNDLIPGDTDPNLPSSSIIVDDGAPSSSKEYSLIEKAMSSVVSIDVMAQSGFSSIGKSFGSGVIISKDGYIVTCNHVVDGASKIYVYRDNGYSSEAVLVGHDSINDLAVLKIEGDSFPYAAFGNSSGLRVGESVFAIGNPLGQFSNTYTRGVISGTNNRLRLDGHDVPLIQTDAAVNKGNSGGGLFRSSDGLLIGIVSAKNFEEKTDRIGLAIPSTVVVNIVRDLMDYGFVRGRPYFGVETETVAVAGLGFFTPNHTYPQVTSVLADSPAQKAGIEEGDIIISVDNTSISDAVSFERLICSLKIGDEVNVTIIRGEETINLTAVLSERSVPSE